MSKTRLFFLLLFALLVAARMCHVEILWEGDTLPMAAARQMLGGKMRDRVRIYCDTTSMPTGERMGNHLKERMAQGWTFLKMDLHAGGTDEATGRQGSTAGMYTRPAPDPTANRPVRRGMEDGPRQETKLPMGAYSPYGEHLFTSTFFTDKALDVEEIIPPHISKKNKNV